MYIYPIPVKDRLNSLNTLVNLEKAKNQELLERIARLELEASQASKPTSPPMTPRTNNEPSRMEAMLEQAMTRMSVLEGMLMNQSKTGQNEGVTSKPAESDKVVIKETKAREASPTPAQESNDSDESSEENEWVTTPTGQQVALAHIIYSHNFPYIIFDLWTRSTSIYNIAPQQQTTCSICFTLSLDICTREHVFEVKISADALRMRTRRLCERKPSGKLHVDASIEKQYKEGGEPREVLEMALLECLAKHGVKRSSYKRIKASSMVGISHACMNIHYIYIYI